jgi:hypothetical protein
MIEAGISIFVQSNAAVAALCTAGGFYTELPKDQALPSWAYQFVSDVPNYTLRRRDPLTMRRLQIDCYGSAAADAIALSYAIDHLLDGYRGYLPDTDQTLVAGCFRSNVLDFFDDASRSYRRLLEYQLWFYQS